MEHQFSVDELCSQLEKAETMDPERKRFGADQHQYQWNPPARREQIEQLEEKIGISLPAEYRKFLLDVGNGGAGPFYGLFSVEQIQQWLQWKIEPEKTPALAPDKTADDLDENDCNWLRGCIPIGSQGDTYFTGLMVAGPDQGRVVYIDYEVSWFFFPNEPNFLSWYQRWLRELCCGYNIFMFGTNLDGDEQELQAYYAKAKTEEDKLEAICAMYKFPELSPSSIEFIQQAMWERRDISDAEPFLSLLYQTAPEFLDRFLQYRWEAGMYPAVVSELRCVIRDIEEEENRIRTVWSERILDKLPQLPNDLRISAIELLKKSENVSLKQVAWVLKEEENARQKQDFLYTFKCFPDAAEQLDIWLETMQERENLNLLHAAIISVPKVPNTHLKETLAQIKNDFSFVQENRSAKDEDEVDYALLAQQERVYKSACEALDDVWYAEINPKIEGIPRPYRLAFEFYDIANMDLNAPIPETGIAIHPFVALAVRQRFMHLPATRFGWEKILTSVKTLSLELNEKTEKYRYDPTRTVYLRAPGEFPLKKPCYYDMKDWSAIGRMTHLKQLIITQICVEDFSFLAQCQNLEQLSLCNTNFSDCRVLMQLPKLKQADLRQCHLEHTDVLDTASFTYTI